MTGAARARQSSSGEVLTVRLVDSIDGLRALERDWRTLTAVMPQPNAFATFDWVFATWLHAAPPDTLLRVIVVERAGSAMLIAPLMQRVVRRKGFVIQKLEFLDTGLSDYCDLICGADCEEELDVLAAHLHGSRFEWDIADLRNVASDAHWLEPWRRALQKARLTTRSSSWEICPYFPIGSSWDDYLDTRSRATRSTYRNQARRLERERENGLRITLLDQLPSVPELIERMAQLERERGGAVDASLVADNTAFFRDVLPALNENGMLYLVLAERDGRLLAFQLGFRCGRKLWDYSKAYARDATRLSLGTMLVPVVVDYGFAHGYTEYDFLRGADPYKQRLATADRAMLRLEVWSARLRSRAVGFLAEMRRR
jgi:CelD/BcsL family acetyltransferase involved in cellulose biosynthesis